MTQNWDAIVLGGGPAGAQCVLWLTKLGLRALLLEPGHLGGLQARSPYTNSWLSVMQATTLAKSVAANIAKNLSEQNCAMRAVACTRVDVAAEGFAVHLAGGDVLRTRNVVIATGTRERTGGLIASDRVAVGLVGLHDLEAKGARIALLGGGDAACEAFGTLMSREPAALHVFARSVRARPAMWDAVPGALKTVGHYTVAEDHVAAGDARFAYDHLLVCYGWTPVVPEIGVALAQDARGHLVVDADMQTSHPGIYAIGDVNIRPYPCVATAISDGVYAAKAIERTTR